MAKRRGETGDGIGRNGGPPTSVAQGTTAGRAVYAVAGAAAPERATEFLRRAEPSHEERDGFDMRGAGELVDGLDGGEFAPAGSEGRGVPTEGGRIAA